jgi:hypothetical protein
MGHSKIEITLNVYGHLLKDREDAKRQTEEELASEILAGPVANLWRTQSNSLEKFLFLQPSKLL